MSIKQHKTRNLVALNPLLKKGGVYHQDTAPAVHQRNKRDAKLRLKRVDWLQE